MPDVGDQKRENGKRFVWDGQRWVDIGGVGPTTPRINPAVVLPRNIHGDKRRALDEDE